MPPIPEVLATLPVFARVPLTHLDALVVEAPLITLKAGQLLYRIGEPTETALLLVEGQLESHLDLDGTRKVLGLIRPGEMVGEQALFLKEGRRGASVTATRPSVGLELSRKAMAKLEENLAVAAIERAMMRTMADRIRATNEALEAVWAPDTTPGPQPTTLRSRLTGVVRGLFG